MAAEDANRIAVSTCESDQTLSPKTPAAFSKPTSYFWSHDQVQQEVKSWEAAMSVCGLGFFSLACDVHLQPQWPHFPGGAYAYDIGL